MSKRFKFKVGDLVTPVGCGPPWEGSTLRLLRIVHSRAGRKTWRTIVLKRPGEPDNTPACINIPEKEMKLMEKQTREDIHQELTKALEEIETLRAQLKWLDATMAKEFDATEFRCWKALQAIDAKTTDVEKAKILAKLIREERG